MKYLAPMVSIAAVIIILFGLREASEIISPILLALVLAITVSPILYWFMDKGLPGWAALLLTLAIDVLIIGILTTLVVSSIGNFADTVSEYEPRIEEIESSVDKALDRYGVDLDTVVADQLKEPKKIVSFAAGIAESLASGLSNWGLILMANVFFLVEAIALPRKVKSVAKKNDKDVKQIMSLNTDLRKYMGVNALAGALAAVLNTGLLAFMGVEFALLWGLFSFFLSFVPNVGFIISVIPPALMALLQFGVQEMLIVVIAYIVLNFLVDNVIKPRFIQESVNLSPTVTFISLVVWGWVLGPIGAILSVPMTIIIQHIFSSREETRWVAYLMGSGSEPFEANKLSKEGTATNSKK